MGAGSAAASPNEASMGASGMASPASANAAGDEGGVDVGGVALELVASDVESGAHQAQGHGHSNSKSKNYSKIAEIQRSLRQEDERNKENKLKDGEKKFPLLT